MVLFSRVGLSFAVAPRLVGEALSFLRDCEVHIGKHWVRMADQCEQVII